MITQGFAGEGFGIPTCEQPRRVLFGSFSCALVTHGVLVTFWEEGVTHSLLNCHRGQSGACTGMLDTSGLGNGGKIVLYGVLLAGSLAQKKCRILTCLVSLQAVRIGQGKAGALHWHIIVASRENCRKDPFDLNLSGVATSSEDGSGDACQRWNPRLCRVSRTFSDTWHV